MEMAKSQIMEHAKINGRNVWHYLVNTDLGEIHIVQHEETGLQITNDYMGFYGNNKAERVFKRIAADILNGKR